MKENLEEEEAIKEYRAKTKSLWFFYNLKKYKK